MQSAIRHLQVSRLLFFVLVLASIALNPVQAAVRFWRNNAGSGNWNDATKWSSVSAADTNAANNGVPAGGDDVRIDNTDGVADTIAFNAASISLSALTIDLTGAGTAGNTLTYASANSISVGYIGVGGYNGVGETNGRGALNQSNGTLSTSFGLDMVVGWGAGSTGIYTLSGTGTVNAFQSIFVGAKGNGTFTQSGGTTNVFSSAVGYLNLGANPGASGTYNLSGGTLAVAKFEIIGDSGTGIFNQSGGTNTISGAGNGLTLGSAATGIGTYTASGSAALTVPGDVTVGLNGSGTFNVQGSANVSIGGALKIGAGDTVNLSGGTLRFDGYTRNATGTFNFTGGTVKLAPGSFAKSFNFDSTIVDIFGANPLIANGRNLNLEGKSQIGLDALGTVTVNNAALTTQNDLSVGWRDNNGTLNITGGSTVNSAKVLVGDNQNSSNDFPLGIVNVSQATWNTGWLILGNGGQAALNITNGGKVVATDVSMGFDDGASGNVALNTALVSGPASSLTATNSMSVGGLAHGKLSIEDSGTVFVTNELDVSFSSTIDINGGTLRMNTLLIYGENDLPNAGKINFNAGTIQLAGSRVFGFDTLVTKFFGKTPNLTAGKNLTVEEVASIPYDSALTINGGTLRAKNLTIIGPFQFNGGVLELTGGSITGLPALNVPSGGEFRASGTQDFRISAAAGSTITATGNLTLGSGTAVNGFYSDGTVAVGGNSVTLSDANDAVLDSGALVSLGSGATPGTVNAANGLTLDFGGNIAGFGTVTTPDTTAKPLINNGHITGVSAAQKITLSGYVKGVGTFDNVNFAGTFSPGLSPAIVQVGNVDLSSSSTLVMELGGTTPGAQYDQLNVSGNLTFGGTLVISLINGFVPAAGQSFNFFVGSNVVGAFSAIELPSVPGLSWNTSQLASGVLSLATGLAGDYNADGKVDAADYTVWRDRLGQTSALPNDDTPGVGPDDYIRWKDNFGQHSGSGAGQISPVPEPTVLLLIAAALPFCQNLRHRRRT